MSTLAINVAMILPDHDTSFLTTLAIDSLRDMLLRDPRISLRELNRSLVGWLKQELRDGKAGVQLVSSKLYMDIVQTLTWSVTLKLKAEA